MSTARFFQDVQPFLDFSEVTLSDNYQQVPEDWFVILTDIKGSTKLVQENRYQDVNFVGAATIISVINACDSRDIPFVFGGDGATILIHFSQLEKVKEALSATIYWAQQEFGIELRASVFSVKELNLAGAQIQLAKFQIAAGNYIAMLSGGGLTLAENWLKSPTDDKLQKHSIRSEQRTTHLEGLSCRFAPIKNSRGLILTVLIQSCHQELKAVEIYKTLLKDLNQIVPSLSLSSPLTTGQLRFGSLIKSVIKEAKARFPENPILGKLKVFLLILIMRALELLKIRILGFEMESYKSELVKNSDYRKFDDMLRLIIDCTPTEAHSLELYLTQLSEEKLIYFGINRSQEALMTCMVQTTKNNQHLHFIDGAQGGYALAAQMMKDMILKKDAP